MKPSWANAKILSWISPPKILTLTDVWPEHEKVKAPWVWEFCCQFNSSLCNEYVMSRVALAVLVSCSVTSYSLIWICVGVFSLDFMEILRWVCPRPNSSLGKVKYHSLFLQIFFLSPFPFSFHSSYWNCHKISTVLFMASRKNLWISLLQLLLLVFILLGKCSF